MGLTRRVIFSQKLKGYGSDYSADDLWELRLDPKKAPHRTRRVGSRTFPDSRFRA